MGSNQTISPEENSPPVRVRVWVRVSFGVGGQFSSEAIVLEPGINALHYLSLLPHKKME